MPACPGVRPGGTSPDSTSLPALFDLRLIIGGLFSLYGVVLVIAGFADGKAELNKASGIRINLWAGLGMLVVGLLFLLWMRLTGDGHDRPDRGDGEPKGDAAPNP